MIQLKCTKCGELVSVPGSQAGQAARCPKCGELAAVPIGTAPAPDAKLPRRCSALVGGLAAALLVTLGLALGLWLGGPHTRPADTSVPPAGRDAPTTSPTSATSVASQLEEAKAMAREALRRVSAAEREVLTVKQQLRAGATSMSSKVIRAERVELVDAKGRKRIELSGTPTTRPATTGKASATVPIGLALFDDSGRCRLSMDLVGEGAPDFRMLLEDGAPVAYMTGLKGFSVFQLGEVGSDVTMTCLPAQQTLVVGRTPDKKLPAVSVWTDSLGPRVTLCDGRDSANLHLAGRLGMYLNFTRDGKGVVGLGLGEDRARHLLFCDDAGGPMASLEFAPTKSACNLTMAAYKANGPGDQPYVSLTMPTVGLPALMFKDQAGRGVVYSPSKPFMLPFDRDGPVAP
jgi:phage FluMu protein Com